MVWTVNIFNTTNELYDGVEGYFKLAGVTTQPVLTVADVITPVQVSFRAFDWLGRTTFFGTGLSVVEEDLNRGPNVPDLPLLASGTVQRIEVYYNYALARARDSGQQDLTPLRLPQFLEPAAVFQFSGGGVPAASFSNAIAQSYLSGTIAPFLEFFRSQEVILLGSDGVNLIEGFGGTNQIFGFGGNDQLQGGPGNDTLDGGAGTDGMDGGEGSDLYLPGPAGAAELQLNIGDSVGDSGQNPNDRDVVSFANAPSGVIVDLAWANQNGNLSDGWARGLKTSGIEVVVGSSFNDVLIGTENPESINDTASDTLVGGSGDDRLHGLNGDDLFIGGPGFDILVGDAYFGAGGGLPITGPGAQDRAFYDATRNEIDLYFRNDGGVAVAAPGADVDILYEIEFIELQNETIRIQPGIFSQRPLVNGTFNSETVIGGGNGELIVGGGGNDELIGNGGDDTLRGGEGNDTLDGGAGTDFAFFPFAKAAYTIGLGQGGVTVVGPDGVDLVLDNVETFVFDTVIESASSVRDNASNVLPGTDDSETIDGDGTSQLIKALDGFDWITPGRGNDTVDGGAGRDMVSYSDVPDDPGRGANFMLDLDLGAGTAEVFGGELDELISIERATGTIFADVMRGSDGDDELRGLGDYDWFIATDGQDTIDGGNGQDMITFVEAQSSGAPPVQDVFANDGAPPAGAAVAGVTLDLGDPSQSTGLAQGMALISVERVTGSSYQDVFYGDANQNDFRGLGGYDWFVGSTGGRERYYGGDGIDTVTYFQSSTGVIASLRNGAGEFNGQETGYGSGGDAIRDLYFEIENLVGTQHRDRLEGNSERNQLAGLGDDDFLYGYGGIDYIEGGDGNDYIDGGAASDYALYDGTLSEYTITRTSATDVTITGRGYTDTLTNVEYFQFDDATANIWEQTIV